MHLVTLGFETYWSQTHTLKKMPPLVYAKHKEINKLPHLN